MRSLSLSTSFALMSFRSAKALVPTTRRGFLLVTPSTMLPPRSFARAEQYLISFSPLYWFLASLNSRCSSSAPRIQFSSCSKETLNAVDHLHLQYIAAEKPSNYRLHVTLSRIRLENQPFQQPLEEAPTGNLGDEA
jgi:hypothetical protein